MRTLLLALTCAALFSTGVGAQEEVYVTKDGEYVIVRTEERSSSSRGLGRLIVGLIILACGGGYAVASQRKFRRPTNRARPTSASTGTRKPIATAAGPRKPARPMFNKPKNRV